MITGTGIDIVNIERITKLLDEHGDRFSRKILSPEEMGAIPEVRPQEYIAGRFAAKEALLKAAGRSFPMTEVSVINDGSGKPFFSGNFFSTEFAGCRVHLSISHDTGYAAAFVIIESDDEVKR